MPLSIRWFITNSLVVALAVAVFPYNTPWAQTLFAVLAFFFLGLSVFMFMALNYVHHVLPASHKGRLTPNIDRPMYQPKVRLIDIAFDVVLSVFIGLYVPLVAVVYFLHTVFLQLSVDTLIHLKRGYHEEVSV